MARGGARPGAGRPGRKSANTSPPSRRARARARVEAGNQRPWPADKVERWAIERLELLRLELGELKLAGFNLSLTGFGDLELKDLLAERAAGLTDPDDAPAVPEHPVSQTGDLWVLGRHRLLCGDSTVATDVERVLGGVAPHLMVTDPPYGVNYDPAWRNQAGRSINGTTRRIAAGTVIKPIGARAVGKVVNDDRADWREAWALFPGSVAYYLARRDQGRHRAGQLSRLRLRHASRLGFIGRH